MRPHGTADRCSPACPEDPFTGELESVLSITRAHQLEVGNPAHTLADASERFELLLVDSRGYGPMHSVMVGGISGRLVRQAACPVIVFARSDGHPEDESLFAMTAALHG